MNDDTRSVHYTTVLPSGRHWSLRLRRGLELRLVDVTGGANVGMLLYNPENPRERYNAPDTLKAQHTFRLTRGHCLYSDMGRVLGSIVHDDLGWHETVCGSSTASMVTERFGARDYQNERNDWHQNGHDAFLVELAKHGLTRADLAAPVNWFSKATVDADGALALVDGHSAAGSEVRLRIDMDALVVLHTCPHPLAAGDAYPDAPVRLSLADAAPMHEDDPCLTHCDENRRGFDNNRLHHLGA